MKTRAECLEKYGADYFIKKNRRGRVAQGWKEITRKSRISGELLRKKKDL